jgi:hypothetical protein
MEENNVQERIEYTPRLGGKMFMEYIEQANSRKTGLLGQTLTPRFWLELFAYVGGGKATAMLQAEAIAKKIAAAAGIPKVIHCKLADLFIDKDIVNNEIDDSVIDKTAIYIVDFDNDAMTDHVGDKRIPIARKLLMMQRTSMVCVYRSDEKSSVPIMPLGYEFTRGHYMSQGAFLCNEYRTFSYRNISGPSGCDIDFTDNKEE